MKILIVFLLFIAIPAFAKNGSSSIGNRPGIATEILSGVNLSDLKIDRNRILDSKTGEPLVEVRSISVHEVDALKNQLATSTLGQAKGFEFTPTRDQAAQGAQNYWIVCKEEGSCTELKPLANSLKVLDVIGSLKN